MAYNQNISHGEDTVDNVNHPKHYTQYEHEVIELTSKLDFCTGNAVKYILRCKLKGGAEDLEKAKWYLDYATKHPEAVHCFDAIGALDLERTFKNLLVSDIVGSVCIHAIEGSYPWVGIFNRVIEVIDMILDGMEPKADEERPDPDYIHIWRYTVDPASGEWVDR